MDREEGRRELEKLKGDISGIKDKLSWKNNSKRRLLAATVLLILFVGVLVYTFQEESGIIPDIDVDQNVDGEIEEVVIDGQVAQPSSPSISARDGIRFVNEAGYDIEIEFGNERDNLILGEGESAVKNIESTVYYSVYPADEDAEFREINARIYTH